MEFQRCKKRNTISTQFVSMMVMQIAVITIHSFMIDLIKNGENLMISESQKLKKLMSLRNQKVETAGKQHSGLYISRTQLHRSLIKTIYRSINFHKIHSSFPHSPNISMVTLFLKKSTSKQKKKIKIWQKKSKIRRMIKQ